jgi:AAHS family 4-hydroxybenzoate transporter-like MFS transporter
MSLAADVIDAGHLVDHGNWTRFQKLVFVLAGLAIVFDGLDLQLLAFAIPTLMHDWHAARASFGPILAGGIVAMALGTAGAGYLGDQIGRKRALLISVFFFGAATVATGFVKGLAGLAVLRFAAGAGLGGAMPNAATLSAEFTPLRRRPLAVGATMVCVPIGGVVAGLIAAPVLQNLGWPWLFILGGAAAIVLTGVLWLALPESPRYLVRRPERWTELTRILRRMGHAASPGATFTDSVEQRRETGGLMQAIFGAGMLRGTLGLWLAFLGSMLCVYLALNWLPTFLAAQGFGVAAASSGLAAWNFAGVFAAFACAGLINLFGSRRVMTASCIGGMGSAVFLWLVPPAAANGLPLAALAIHGFFANAVQTSMYALAAHVYPTRVRARGMAAAVTVGRIGAFTSALAGAGLVQAGARSYFGTIALALGVTMLAATQVREHIPRFRSPRKAV